MTIGIGVVYAAGTINQRTLRNSGIIQCSQCGRIPRVVSFTSVAGTGITAQCECGWGCSTNAKLLDGMAPWDPWWRRR